jgi:hypothetical protein
MAAVGFILISASFIISAVGMTCLPSFFNHTFPLDRACLASGQVASTTITRGDWCDVFKKAANDGVALSDAIRGLHVHAGTLSSEYMDFACGTRVAGTRWIACPGNGTKPIDVPTNTVLNELIEGIPKDLMGLMSTRWGFNYTIYHGPPKPSNLSVAKWLAKFGHAYDLIIGVVSDTAERRKLGISIPYMIWENSPRLIVNLEKVDAEFWDEMIGFTKPFTPELWGLIVGCSIATAVIIWLFEVSNVGREQNAELELRWKHGYKGVLKSAYLAGEQFTGAGGLNPATTSGRVVALSWSFAVLILVSSCTHNSLAVASVGALCTHASAAHFTSLPCRHGESRHKPHHRRQCEWSYNGL